MVLDKANFNDIRKNNLSLVFQTILKSKTVSRADISKITGLTRATVSSLASELIDLGFIEDIGESGVKSVGKRATLLHICTSKIFIISLEFYSSTINVAKVDINGKVHQYEQKNVSDSASAAVLLKAIYALIDSIFSRMTEAGELCYGIGIAMPAPVMDGAMRESIHFSSLCGVNLVAKLEQRYHCCVTVTNIADAAALAESWYGNHPAYNCMAYIWVQQGIGCGVIRNGKLVLSDSGLSSEFGHSTIKIDGDIPCFCGKSGCLTSYGSDRALARCLLEHDATKDMVSASGKILSIDYARLTAYLNDSPSPRLLDQINQIAMYLGCGISNLVDTIVPDVIVFTGNLFHTPGFLDAVKTYCLENIHPLFRGSFEFMTPTVTKHVELIGASMFLLDDLYTNPYKILSVNRP